MEIDKSKGIHKYVHMLFDGPSQNLCLYFWQCVWTSFLLVSAPVAFVAGPLDFFLDIHLGRSWWDLLSLFYIVFGYGIWMTMGGVISLLVCIWPIYLIYEYIQLKSIDKKPSVVVEYVKARKEKICPMITFVEE